MRQKLKTTTQNYIKNSKHSSKILIALGLAGLLPSFAFSSDSDDTLAQLLSVAPVNPNDSKTQTSTSYSPVVDLRTLRVVEVDETSNPPFPNGGTWDANTIVNINIENVDYIYKTTRIFQANNGANVVMNFNVVNPQYHSMQWGSTTLIDSQGILTANESTKIAFRGDGMFDITASITGNVTDTSATFMGIWDYGREDGIRTEITSRFKFQAKDKLRNFVHFYQGENGSGKHIWNSPYIEIDMSGSSWSGERYVISNGGWSNPFIYINANQSDTSQADNKTNILKFTGSIDIGTVYSARLYAHFTNSDSFLKGNLGLNSGESNISFSNNASMTGDINITGDGTHSITFNNASFMGIIKSSTGNDNGSNSTITFTNTAGKTFGSTTSGVVDSTYRGKIVGSFDLSSNSATKIRGGSDGSKGFLGTGTNILTFDFKNSANTSSNSKFTVSGGNASSLYTLSGFALKNSNGTLDLSSLSSSNTLFSMLNNAGVIFSPTLSGTLLFNKTNIQVGSDEQALFASSSNLTGASSSLKFQAMFGNAIWSDNNGDGAISRDEITNNAGNLNYKLTSSTPQQGGNITPNTSTGNIGKEGDGIEKQVAFIFSNNDGYDFGGEKQGFSGSIAGGTATSKYYFANAGYLTRTQIENALGDLVLFNTAFRGDLGVKNASVSISLDFSNNRNGLRAEIGEGYSNIVGNGAKNILFDFTNNTKAIKFGGSVIGASSNATYTLLNLKKYSQDDILDGDGRIKVATTTRNAGTKTLIDAIQESGLSNFNKALSSWSSGYGDGTTNIGSFSDTTTLSLRGTSLDATNIDFSKYKYILAFGDNLDNYNGFAVSDSKLYGDIDLSSNTQTGHSIILKGNSLGNASTAISFNGSNFGQNGGGVFVYDDSLANIDSNSPKTLKLSGLSQSNYLYSNSALNISKTNLEGDIYAHWSVPLNLDFTNGRTWKMDTSGIYLRGQTSIVIDGKVSSITQDTIPVLKLRHDANASMNRLEFTNTGMTIKLYQQGSWKKDTRIGQSFSLRGTSLETFWASGTETGSENGIHGYADNGIKLVFAKGNNIETTVINENGAAYNITDEGSGEGNYIAESYGSFTKVVTNTSFDITFIGNQAKQRNWGSFGGYFNQASKLTLINADNQNSNSNYSGKNFVGGGQIGGFFQSNESGNGNSNARADITIKGTSIAYGGKIVTRTNNQGSLYFDMTFVKSSNNQNNSTPTYIDTKYGNDLAYTNANGALTESILKVAESSLLDGLDFKGANFNLLFVGDGAQSLDGTNVVASDDGTAKILRGGTSSSLVTFRDSDLNAGNGTSSIQNISGTIAFDLTHTNEDMAISGILKNMLASTGKHQVRFKDNNGNTLSINSLVFVDVNDIALSNATLSALSSFGNYFYDSDVFANLSSKNYSSLALLNNVSAQASSSLKFASGSSVALESGEVIFVGQNSHSFDSSETSTANKLGNSTGGTLTFVDAGTLKIDNLLNTDTSGTQQGRGTINLIGTTQIETQTLNSKQTLSLKKGNATGSGITINAIFTGSNPLGASINGIEKNTNISSHSTSTADIGQEGEQTIYHILFDYTTSNLVFGVDHAYSGSIIGLTENSTIKFKNAGYISENQIANTRATILVDNTQIRGDFRGDVAVLDFRNSASSIAGNILSSDTVGNNLSQKVLTFDLTRTQNTGFNYAIQVGNKVAPTYTQVAPSVLTFQNAPSMSIGDDSGSNPSEFLKSIAKDIGFSSLSSAKTTADGYVSTDKTHSYVLEGTSLVFQGTNISATNQSLVENTYDLSMNFDVRESGRGVSGLGETLNKSVLAANSITMGVNRNLSLSFNNRGSLQARSVTIGNTTFNNILQVNLSNNANFILNSASSNGNIGTIVLNPLSQNALAQTSSLNIAAGTLGLVGSFVQNTGGGTSGDIIASFNGANKAYGSIAGSGVMNITLSGNALFSKEQAQALGYSTPSSQFADLVIDVSNASSSTLTLSHASGVVGVVGALVTNSYTNLNLSNTSGDIALKGNFNLTEGASFGGNNSSHLKVIEDLTLKLGANKSLTIAEDGIIDTTLGAITVQVFGAKTSPNNLTFINLGDKISNVAIFNSEGWGVQGNWNFRGTNVKLSYFIGSEYDKNAGYSKRFVFANGDGTKTTVQSPIDGDFLTLSQLENSDKIANSSLEFVTSSGARFNNGFFTFIGKTSIKGNVDNQILNGSYKDSGKLTMSFYNTLLKSGSQILNNAGEWDHDINDVANIYGTDVFNMSVMNKSTTNTTNNEQGLNNSTINAVFVNGSNLVTSKAQSLSAKAADTTTILTGNTYIDSSKGSNTALRTTLAQYETNNAGGVLSETRLRTLQSKAYGNITMESTVTANMKFIGDDSHSFDGKTKVSGNNIYHTSDDVNWYQYEVGDGTNNTINGAIYSSSTPMSAQGSFATLSGGNSSSRFDFDHTSVKLDLIKNAGGNTYVYNSSIIGEIAVSSNSNSGSTTLFFNQAFNENSPLSLTAQKFVNLWANNGITLDTTLAHTLKSTNLESNGKLASTSKTTNIILIGKNAFEGTAENSEGINLSFLPNANSSSNYNYTIVSGGIIDAESLETQLGGNSTSGNYPNSTDIPVTSFGDSHVQLIDTYAVGRITFGQVGFIDVKDVNNQKSMWAGSADQFLIFDFNNGAENNKLYGGKTPAIANTSLNSHYIFTSFFTNSDELVNKNLITLTSSNSLRTAINAQLGSEVLSSDVKGFLGTRGVSIQGNIIEDNTSGNNVDIVFNSTNNLAYQEYFDESGNHVANIVEAPNYVSTGVGDDQKISGYSQLKPLDTNNSVTIGGAATKQITFIGQHSVSLGLDYLKIEGGSVQSTYTFHTVGHLSSAFFNNISSANADNSRSIALGTFTFINSFVESDISLSANGADINANNQARLVFDNVHYSGTISGNLIKDLKFGTQSGHIVLKGGNNASRYDFGYFDGKKVLLDVDMSVTNAGNTTYLSPSIIGFNGNTSLQGSLLLAKTGNELNTYDANYTNSFIFNNDAQWIVTDDSRVMNLSLSNTQSNYNLDLSSASRSSGFRTLEVGSLSSNGGQVLLGTSINPNNQASTKDNADQIVADVLNGTLYVTAVDSSIESGVFDTSSESAVVLVTANSTSSNANVVGATHSKGLSYITTQLEHQVTYGNDEWFSVDENNTASSSDTQRWVLSELKGESNQELIDESTFVISNPYYMLLIESNNLNKRMGELRDNPYTQGAWIRIFNGMDSGEGIKNSYTNIQLGYDYATAFIGAKNYTGVALSTSIVDISGDYYSGKANTYSLALYNSYIADNGFYVDSIFKYMYNYQTLTPAQGESTPFGNNAYSLGLEIGYRQYLGDTHFYVETQAEAIAGIVQKINSVDLGEVGGMNIIGDLKTTFALSTRVGLVSGYSLKTQSGFGADFRVGASLVNESTSQNDNIILRDGITQSATALGNDTKAVVEVGVNLILTDQWRVYLDAERSFGGKRNTDYQANVGARFSFGEIAKPLEKPKDNLPVKIEGEKGEK